jgi:hypothetical protein
MYVKIQLFEFGAYSSDAIRFLSVGKDEKRSLQRKSKRGDGWKAKSTKKK